MSSLTDLACELIARPSVTPADEGCQRVLGERLEKAGFRIESMDAGNVTNLWARRGNKKPLLCFAGHTDVVPAGPLEDWHSPPFEPVLRDGVIYGRGAADMKGALAAMVVAIERFVAERPQHEGALAVLLTSDEEGPATCGTRAVMEKLDLRDEKIDYCVVGEPSSLEASGDQIRIGRRGSLNVALTIHGTQGHVAYPEKGGNPIHAALPVLDELVNEVWDNGEGEFPPTHLQFTDIEAGVGASNVTPATLHTRFNLRFSPACPADAIEARITRLLTARALRYTLECRLSGEPFYTGPGTLREAAQAALLEVCGQRAAESTGGGTSDGRFIAPSGAQVIELGPPGKTLHQANEQVSEAELERLAVIYLALMRRLLP